MIMANIQKYQAEVSSWIIDSIIERNINISKSKPQSDSSYIKLSNKLNHVKKLSLMLKIPTVPNV